MHYAPAHKIFFGGKIEMLKVEQIKTLFNKGIVYKLILIVPLLLNSNLSYADEVQKSTNDIPVVEVVAKFDHLRPGYVAMSSDGRTFLTVSPFSNPETKVVELFSDGSTKPYPNAEYVTGKNSVIQSTIGAKMDSKDNLWILDMTTRQFVVWDTKKNTLNKILKVPSSTLKETSFLQDFVLDEKRNRIIIADPTRGKDPKSPAFIVLDMTSGQGIRMAENNKFLQSEKENGSPVNPIAIDPQQEWVYFGSLHGTKIFRVPAKSFESESELLKNIEVYGPKSFSDGIAVDEKQNVYITNIQEQTIGVTQKDSYKDIARLPKGQSWPDGLFIKDGYVYGVVNQLNRTAALNNGKDISKPPFLIVKTKLVP